MNLNPGPEAAHSIEQHRQILQRAGYEITGPPVLLPAMDDDGEWVPGVFQVWWPTVVEEATHEPAAEPDPANQSPGWMWVSPDGNVVYMDYLPEADL